MSRPANDTEIHFKKSAAYTTRPFGIEPSRMLTNSHTRAFGSFHVRVKATGNQILYSETCVFRSNFVEAAVTFSIQSEMNTIERQDLSVFWCTNCNKPFRKRELCALQFVLTDLPTLIRTGS